MDQPAWDRLSPEEKKTALFLKQKDLLDTFIKEPVIRILLDLDKVGDFNDFVDTGIGLALGLALFDGMNHYQITS